MRKSGKRAFSLLLSVLLLVALLPQLRLSVAAEGGQTPSEIVASGTCGENLNWTLSKTGVLTITGTGPMTDYTVSDPAPWPRDSYLINTVVIDHGVTHIGDWAFHYCEQLTNVTIPDSVTTIGDYAFFRCFALRSIVIPKSITGLGANVFSSCSKLDFIIFLGSVPFMDNTLFPHITATAYYPCNNPTWTDSAQQNYGGEITWQKNHHYTDDVCTDCKSVWTDVSGSCGTSAQWKLDSSGTLTISGSGKMAEYCYDDFFEEWSTLPGWAKYLPNIKTVVIEDGITSIGDFAFYNCVNLTSVFIPKSVTDIGDSAFYYCTDLTTVTIPESVTDIGCSAFYGCSRLTEITVPKGVKTIQDSTFCNCWNLVSVSLPEGITSIEHNGFNNCERLKDFSIPKSVTNIGSSAFQSCNSLTEVTVPEGVTHLATDTFRGCTRLVSAKLPESLTSVDSYVFSNCFSLTTVNIPKSLSIIDLGMFWSCCSLTSVTIPEGVTKLDNLVFGGCTGLTTVTFLGSAPDIAAEAFSNVTASAFYPCINANWNSSKLSAYGGNLTWQANHSFGDDAMTQEATCTQDASKTGTCLNCGNAATVITTGTATGHHYDGNGVCVDCAIEFKLTIYMTDTYGDSWNGSAIQVYTGDTLLTEVSLSGGTLNGNAEVPYVPGRSYQLKWKSSEADSECGFKITLNGEMLASGQGSSCSDGQLLCAFTTACAHVYQTTVTPPTCTEEGYTTGTCTVCGYSGIIGTIPATGHSYAEGVCTVCRKEEGIANGSCGENLQWRLYEDGTLTISGTGPMKNYTVTDDGTDPDTPWCQYRPLITKVAIQSGVTTIGEYAFHGCHVLTDITIPGSVTSIGKLAFYRCYALTELTIPEGVTTLGSAVFRRCYGLTKVSLPESLTTIGKIAFFDCTGLPEVTIPKNVTSIGEHGLANCTSLTAITFTGPAPTMGTDCLRNVTATAFYPCNHETWTDTAKQGYGGAITWQTGHTKTTLSRQEPTCTQTGLTEGVQCSVCNEVLIPQKTIPVIDHAYLVTQVSATCTDYGYELYQCQDCGFKSYYNVTSPYGHRYENGSCIDCGAAEFGDLIGDLDGDGSRTIADVAQLYAYVQGSLSLDATALTYADVNGDGNVNIADTARLYAHVQGTTPLN